MKSPVQEFSAELDVLIKNGSSVDAFDMPVDYIENLEVEVICSTYIDNRSAGYDGLHFILKIGVENESTEVFCRITLGDGGVLTQKSNFTNNIMELLINSEEGWSYF